MFIFTDHRPTMDKFSHAILVKSAQLLGRKRGAHPYEYICTLMHTDRVHSKNHFLLFVGGLQGSNP
jgi:hypothetical protein